jgi:hypothetical protein
MVEVQISNLQALLSNGLGLQIKARILPKALKVY